MGEHMVMPPLVPEALADAFDASWLGATSGGDDAAHARLALDCGTVASNALLERWNAHVARAVADPAARQRLTYVRPQMAAAAAAAVADGGRSSSAAAPAAAPAAPPPPRDADLAGPVWHQLVDAHVQAALAQWRAHCAARGINPREDANAWRAAERKGERKVGAKATPARGPAAAAAAATAAEEEAGEGVGAAIPPTIVSPTSHHDPALRQLLATVPTIASLKQQLHARFRTAALLDSAASDEQVQATLTGLLERRQLDDRRNVATAAIRNAPVPGAPVADLSHRAFPPPVDAAGGWGTATAQAGAAGGSGSSSAAAPTAPPPYEAEVVFRVGLYSPAYVRREQDFLVLGSNTLAQLRDRLYCKTDGLMALARQRRRTAAAAADTLGDQCASFFYIEGVLYDDRRPGREVMAAAAPPPAPVAASAGAGAGSSSSAASDAPASGSSSSGSGSSSASASAPQARYLSEPIVAWAANAARRGRSSGWGVLQSGDMATTTFASLRPRLGAHYLFCHGGDCEHILIFMDARLLCAAPGGYDALGAQFYPRHVYQARIRRRRCAACEVAFATLVAFGDRLAESNPEHYCEPCFTALHSVSDGAGGTTLLSGPDAPQVFPYTHD